MAKYRLLSDSGRHVDVGGRTVWVEPGDVVDLPDDGRYVQTGATGETPLFEPVTPPTHKKAAKPQEEGE